jgi:universal stress protein A
VSLATLKLILLPTDFSDSTGPVLRAAIGMARTFDAAVEVFHVDVDPSDESLLAESIFPVQMVFDSLHKETEEQLRRVIDEVRQAGVPCTGAAELGRSPASIVEHARRVEAGLIVIGRHPGPAMGRPFHGHVADKVIQHAPCPVLVVPLPRD